MNIVLLGPRACGKTTIGRLLANRMRQSFVDLDERTLTVFPQSSVREVWAAYGEEGWRMAELAAFKETIREDDQVIASGGGTVMIPEVQPLIERGRRDRTIRTVYLKCSAEALIERLKMSPGDRPSLLAAASMADEIRSVLSDREPIYVANADVVYEAGAVTAEVAAQALMMLITRNSD